MLPAPLQPGAKFINVLRIRIVDLVRLSPISITGEQVSADQIEIQLVDNILGDVQVKFATNAAACVPCTSISVVPGRHLLSGSEIPIGQSQLGLWQCLPCATDRTGPEVGRIRVTSPVSTVGSKVIQDTTTDDFREVLGGAERIGKRIEISETRPIVGSDHLGIGCANRFIRIRRNKIKALSRGVETAEVGSERTTEVVRPCIDHPAGVINALLAIRLNDGSRSRLGGRSWNEADLHTTEVFDRIEVEAQIIDLVTELDAQIEQVVVLGRYKNTRRVRVRIR